MSLTNQCQNNTIRYCSWQSLQSGQLNNCVSQLPKSMTHVQLFVLTTNIIKAQTGINRFPERYWTGSVVL